MKISNCPICGKQPTTTTLVYSSGIRLTMISCSGANLLDALTAAPINNHPPLNTGKRNTKAFAAKAWNKIVFDINAKSERKCVNGNCSIRATCGRYHQAANVFEARGADGLYDSHSCRKGKCDHHVVRETGNSKLETGEVANG
jgi:hypothetical protein